MASYGFTSAVPPGRQAAQGVGVRNPRAYTGPVNQNMRNPAGGGLSLVVDLKTATDEVSRYIARLGKDVSDRALYNALNHEGDKLRTQIRRHVTNQSGLSYGYVSAHFKELRAHPGRLEYRIIANDAPKKLSEFAKGLVAGQKGVSASPWGKTRFFAKAFVVRFGGHLEIVKRIAPHSAGPGRGRLGVKIMWGPRIPFEHLRPDDKSYREYTQVMQQKIVPRVVHELTQASIRAGAH